MGIFHRKNKINAEELRNFFPFIRNVYSGGLFDIENNLCVDNAVSLISNTIAIMEPRLMVYTKQGVQEAWGNPISHLLKDPAVEETSTLFYKTIIRQLLCTGNAFILKHKNRNGEVISLEIIDPTRVNVKRDTSGNIKRYHIIGGEGQIFTDAQVIHIPYIEEGYNGTKGNSPAILHRQVIERNELIADYIKIYFKNGVGSRLLVELGDKYEPGNNKLNTLVQAFNAYFQEFVIGSNNAGRPMIAPPGSKITTIEQTSNVQSDVLALYDQSSAEVYRLFNIPPELLISKENKYNSLETQQQYFYVRVISPLVNHIAKCLEKGLLDGVSGYFIKFDETGLLETDPQKKAEYYLKLYHGGVVNLNETRKKLGLNAVSNEVEGNTRFLPTSLFPATEENINAFLAKSKLALEQANNIDNSGKEDKTEKVNSVEDKFANHNGVMLDKLQ